MQANVQFETLILSSLSKVFADEKPSDTTYHKASALRGEQISFQVAYTANHLIKNIHVYAESSLGVPISIRSVGLVPSEMPCHVNGDEYAIRTAPGLFPDPLFPLENHSITAIPGQWRSIWVDVQLDTEVPAGAHQITIRLVSAEEERLGEEVFELTVIPNQLPKQKLIHTEWFHADCLATHYKVDVFSEAHWKLIGDFIETAVKHGINMILTPLFTLPLDTAVGGERPTVQLVGVSTGSSDITGHTSYSFDFEKLERWVALCQNKGVTYFEFSHLFTQWGAKHTPKIMADVNGQEQQIFGWATDASGETYRHFLGQFLPELDQLLKRIGIASCSYFHISDEPILEHFESYKKASDIVKTYLSDYPIIKKCFVTELTYIMRKVLFKSLYLPIIISSRF